jgi:hypothetical protein
MRCYTALLFAERPDRFRVEFPDFAGSAAWASSFGDVPGIAARLLAAEIVHRRDLREPLPVPGPASAMAARAQIVGALPVVVPAPLPVEEKLSVTVELPAGLVERVDRRALTQGVGRADLIAKAARLALWETGRAAHGNGG